MKRREFIIRSAARRTSKSRRAELAAWRSNRAAEEEVQAAVEDGSPPTQVEIQRAPLPALPPIVGAGPIVGKPVFAQTLMLGPNSFLIHGYYVHTSPKGGTHDHVIGLSQYAILMVRHGDTWRIENVPQVAWKSS